MKVNVQVQGIRAARDRGAKAPPTLGEILRDVSTALDMTIVLVLVLAIANMRPTRPPLHGPHARGYKSSASLRPASENQFASGTLTLLYRSFPRNPRSIPLCALCALCVRSPYPHNPRSNLDPLPRVSIRGKKETTPNAFGVVGVLKLARVSASHQGRGRHSAEKIM